MEPFFAFLSLLISQPWFWPLLQTVGGIGVRAALFQNKRKEPDEFEVALNKIDERAKKMLSRERIDPVLDALRYAAVMRDAARAVPMIPSIVFYSILALSAPLTYVDAPMIRNITPNHGADQADPLLAMLVIVTSYVISSLWLYQPKLAGYFMTDSERVFAQQLREINDRTLGYLADKAKPYIEALTARDGTATEPLPPRQERFKLFKPTTWMRRKSR